MTLSGRARYTNSKTHSRSRCGSALADRNESTPSAVIVSTSPASTSRTKRAPMASSAALSDATAHPPPGSRPRASGRKPTGSRAATIASAVSIVKV